MNKQKLKIAVIGCGAIAEAFHLPALQANPRTRDGIYLIEKNAQRLSELQAKYPSATTLDDYENLDAVDGVIIATPPSTHGAIVRHFVEQGIPVLCEKPLTDELWEAKELAQLSQKVGTPILINQTRRLFPTYRKIKQLIAEGALGELQSIVWHDGMDFDWPASSAFHFQPNAKGVLSDTGIHMLDTICFWLGAKPKLVDSLNDSDGGPEAMSTVHMSHQGCDIEVKISRLGRMKNGFEIVGSKGRIEAETEEFCEVFVEGKDGRRRRHYCGSRKVTYPDFAKPLIQNFCEVIDGSAEPLVSASSVCDPIELIEEAYETARSYPEPWNSHLQPGQDSALPSTAKKILVTGASGFLGNRIVEALAISGKAEPVALVRSWCRASRPSRYRGVEVRVGDLENDMSEALAGIDAVIHCAYTPDSDSIIDGTKNLLRASEQAGVEHFVYLSSSEVYGAKQEGTITETASLQSAADSYGNWKDRAEQAVRDANLSHTILRPSIIYGPGSMNWSVDLAKRLQSGKWGIYDEFGNGFANLVFVDDLVKAIMLGVTSENARNQTFNVNGPEPGTWNDYFRQYNDALKLPPLPRIAKSSSNLKTYALEAVGSVTSMIKDAFEDKLMEIYLRGGPASRWMKWLKGELDSTPSVGELTDLYCRKAIYDDTKIREMLGYEPDFSLHRGINQTLAWLEHHELADSGLYDPRFENQSTRDNVEVMQ